MAPAAALPLAALLAWLPVLADAAPPGQCRLTRGRDCHHDDLKSRPLETAEECCDFCTETKGCTAFTFAQGKHQYKGAMCYLKGSCSVMTDCDSCTAGVVGRTDDASPTVLSFAADEEEDVSDFLYSVDCIGADISEGGSVHAKTPKDCSDKCAATRGCRAFTHKTGHDQWEGAMCYLKEDCLTVTEDSNCTSGIMIGLEPAPAPAPTPPTPPFRPPSREAAALIQTARHTGDRLTAKDDVEFVADFDTLGPVVDVGSTETDQAIVGFGGAFTEASALVFAAMGEDLQKDFLNKYFDADAGIGYSLGRVHINSCDFSPVSWSEDDMEGDYALAHFDTSVSHDADAMIPLIKAAMQTAVASGRELKIFASPWSPPAWMKTNGKMVNGGKLRPECAASWALYFVKWISAYKAQGVPIWAVTPQNEPMNPAGWEACVYTPEEEAEWLGNHLGPALRLVHPEVLILPYDHNKDAVHEWARTILNHPTAANYAHGIAFHWYSGDQFEAVAQVHREHPRALLLPSEATWERHRWRDGAASAAGDWSFGEGYAHDIMGDLNAGAAGWTDWNLLLNERGGPNHLGNYCDAPMMADVRKGELYVHPQYYFVGHFSKYLLPGSRRILSRVTGTERYTGPNRRYGTCGKEDGLEATAFQRPDGRVAVVILNCGDVAIDFKLKDGRRALRASVPARGIQTYLFHREKGLYV